MVYDRAELGGKGNFDKKNETMLWPLQIVSFYHI